MTPIRRAAVLVLLLLVAARAAHAAPHAAMPPAAPRPAPVELHDVRSLYFEAVDDERAIERGLARVEQLRRAHAPEPGSELGAVLDAYRGALVTLRAKHALWPGNKLKHLRAGLALLDASVRAQPDHVEVRFLRLMSCYYLPGILGRSGSVREDFRALSRLLPDARERYPARLYRDMLRFVLRWEQLPTERRAPLAAALAAADE